MAFVACDGRTVCGLSFQVRESQPRRKIYAGICVPLAREKSWICLIFRLKSIDVFSRVSKFF